MMDGRINGWMDGLHGVSINFLTCNRMDCFCHSLSPSFSPSTIRSISIFYQIHPFTHPSIHPSIQELRDMLRYEKEKYDNSLNQLKLALHRVDGWMDGWIDE